MAEIQHVEMFNCKPEQIYNILVDYEKYPEYLKDVKSCKVIEQKNPTEKIVEYKISVIKDITYVNRHREVPHSEIHWDFVRGDLFKSMSGAWILQEVGGKTKATYRIQAEFGLFVPGFMTKTALSVNLPTMMQAYKKRLKELYGNE